MTIWHMRIACWIPKATNIHTGCVMLSAFPLQPWLQECATMVRYTHTAPLVSHFVSVHQNKLFQTTWQILFCSTVTTYQLRSTAFFFASSTVHFVNIRVKTNKSTNYSFKFLIMYGSSYMFRHYIAIFRERS
jgi:hypothetical protein